MKRKRTITFTLTLEVYDVKEFRAEAKSRALTDGLTRGEAAKYSRASLGECAVMIMDPGESPAGCSIICSSAEEDTLL